jgi:hypothetical protein
MTQNKEHLKKELINFQIRSVDLLGSYLSIPKESNPPIQDFSFDINLERKVDHNLKSLVVITNINISTTSNISEKLGSVSTACVFTIHNFDEVIKMDENKLTHSISDGMMDILNSISMSSTRGVMSQIFRGTFLHHAILPIVDPKSFNQKSREQK